MVRKVFDFFFFRDLSSLSCVFSCRSQKKHCLSQTHPSSKKKNTLPLTSLNGWSHRPDEFATAEDIEAGTKALALALAELAGDAGGAEKERKEAGRCPVTGAVGKACSAAATAAARKRK